MGTIEPPVLADEDVTQELIDAGDLLPVGTPFYPGETDIPAYQLAWGIIGDEDGEPIHGEPLNDDAEKEIIVPVEEPGPMEALVYLLTSEVNFNDSWAIAGDPVSTFKGHDTPWHITGSGGLGYVAAVGDALEEQGRIEVGDMVNVYAGQFDPIDPKASKDPMFSSYEIQGYQTPDGSHQQFMLAQGTQLFKPPQNLNLTEAGSYILTMGTIYRALFTTLDVKPNSNLFVEGASTGTGRDAVVMAASQGLDVTGMVSSEERAERAREAGATATVNRKDAAIVDAMTDVPHDPDEWAEWEAAGEPLLSAFRDQNDGELADYAVSHAGKLAFSRSYQLLGEGGRLTFYGASTGHELSFLGKGGSSDPETMFSRAELRPGQSVLVWYGTPDDVSGTSDEMAETAIESALGSRARVAVITETDEQAEYVEDEYDVAGVLSLETLADENDSFEYMDSFPDIDDPSNLGAYMGKMFKPLGIALGGILKTPNNPRGNPDVVFERAGQNTLAVSTMLCFPFQGKVVFAEEMAGSRYSFYAPQVWMRQRRIYMPTTEIFGTHMKNPWEVAEMNEAIELGAFGVPNTHLTAWDDAQKAHQDMWDNTHEEGSYVINHALPEDGLEDEEALHAAWDEQ
ncbi:MULTISPECIES: zinc-binding dehydrogenase [unclassified Haladaptatus]|uniref:zinc-binding dehydrogenase n=1 Tax=unclassified Haladaptatus TaxID=2622732 RepID=UPI0023E7CAA0|nr:MULTISPECIES: zinc-binding dehydrogenase [unclassified Haladaptatus]